MFGGTMLKKEESVVVTLGDAETWCYDGYVVVYNNDKMMQHYSDYIVDEPDRRGHRSPNAYQVLEELRIGDIDDECVSETYCIHTLLDFYLTAQRMGLSPIINDVMEESRG
jgi:hypothetical protein